jgi:hypothetical protein
MSKRHKIFYVPNFMPEDVAKSITEYAKTHTLEFSDFGNSEQEFTVHTYHEIEKNDPELILLMQEWALKVYDFVKNTYGGEFEDFYGPKTHIAKFVPGSGMHEHYDTGRPKDIATLVYLNDDYTNSGNIVFEKQNRLTIFTPTIEPELDSFNIFIILHSLSLAVRYGNISLTVKILEL